LCHTLSTEQTPPLCIFKDSCKIAFRVRRKLASREIKTHFKISLTDQPQGPLLRTTEELCARVAILGRSALNFSTASSPKGARSTKNTWCPTQIVCRLKAARSQAARNLRRAHCATGMLARHVKRSQLAGVRLRHISERAYQTTGCSTNGPSISTRHEHGQTVNGCGSS
jgi:hypothetical protein